MTLKEELEILRGEPIEEYSIKPEDVPCIETSDAEKLCKHPVVSVQMITYNHEPYIRQAIEGVMMQKTDFEFELIIGEDCSQDKTREICFEYQKKYPDKIRVLWWHENVSKLGGNSRRCRAHSRGEFIALCEGDDYWIDLLKLQKQVDVMRKYPSVGMVFANAKRLLQVHDQERLRIIGKVEWDEAGFGKFYNCTSFSAGLLHKDDFFEACRAISPATGTILFRKNVFDIVSAKFEIFSWKLCCGDHTLWNAFSFWGDMYFMEDDYVSVYRMHDGGISTTNQKRVYRDAEVIKCYFEVMRGKGWRRRGKLLALLLKGRVMAAESNNDWGIMSVFGGMRLRDIYWWWKTAKGFHSLYLLVRLFHLPCHMVRCERVYSIIRHPFKGLVK